MPAVIESTLYDSPGGAVVPGSTQQNSRDDLRLGYQVVLHSVHEATTYSWTLAFASDSPGSSVPGTPFDGTSSSSALLAPEGSTSRDAKFNVDFEGTYLIRLVVDAGLPTEDTQFIRCRVLTMFAALKLVAAGERRDEQGVVPVDATPEGWANDQNANFQRIAVLLRRTATSGRVLYVDANRGRDNAADQDDYDNVIALPGPDVARPEETGIKVRAMAHGDFSSINEAIAYASAAASRGEPAPSKTNPYFIYIRPGFYNEDLNLVSFVHLVGDTTTGDPLAGDAADIGPRLKPVVIRSLNTAGVGTHTYNPQLPGTSAECFLLNLHLENTADTANPVVLQQGGLLYLRNCVVRQNGNAVNQGAALHCETANAAYAPQTWLEGTSVATSATTADRSAVYFDAPDSIVVLMQSQVAAPDCVGLTLNPSLYENSECTLLKNSVVSGQSPIQGYPSELSLRYSSIEGSPHSVSIDITPPGGVGVKVGDVRVSLIHATVYGAIQFKTANATGQTRLEMSGLDHESDAGVVLPDAPGTPLDENRTWLMADSLRYVKGYADYRQGPGAPSSVPVLNQVDEEDVQRVLDLLWQGTFPVTGSPFYSLASAYNGLATISPFTPGVGLGRTINALGGAVQIIGASYPTGLDEDIKHGGLQVEGVIDIGGLIGSGGSLALVGGSEIHLNPNMTGGGPFIGLGRAAWANGVIQKDRGFGGAAIVAGGALAPAGTEAYHLHLRTADRATPNTGKTGNVYVVAGATNGVNEAGEIHLVGGSHLTPGGTVGNLWLVPGGTDTPSTGVIWLVGAPDPLAGAARAELVPVNPFVPGTSGMIVFGTPSGVEMITLTGAEANAAAVVAAVNAQARGIVAADVGGKVVLYSEYGPAGDILYMGDSAGGALNTALGDYILGNGAVFTPGAYGNKVGVDVPQDGRMRVLGDLEVTGSIIGGGASGGLGSYKAVNSAISPYSPAAGEGVFACITSGGTVQINLPASGDPSFPAGTVMIFQHTTGANSVLLVPSAGETINGGALYEMVGTSGGGVAAPRAAVAIFRASSTDWKIWSEYRPNPTRVRFEGGNRVWLAVEEHDIYSCQLSLGVDIQITLDVAMEVGRTVTLKDEYGLANAVPSPGGQKITVLDGGGGLIDGAASFDITVAYGSVTLYKTQAGNWAII